jgi:hypothetical protein
VPGYPGAAHNNKFIDCFNLIFEAGSISDATTLARQVLLPLDGSFTVVLLHRDPSYMHGAGEAAFALVEMELAR